ARAGDAGRGFAVVAVEVRALAQRTAQASQEIRGLIRESSQQVRTGVDLVIKAGTALGGIVESIKRASDIVAEIASASSQQAVGVREADESVSRMEAVTQQNAALVEHTTVALADVDRQMRQLLALTSFFHEESPAAPAAGFRPGRAA
ncbi:MAG: methyl-accepting chemotaxis protein, partial [Dongiaceae bacterium]